MPCPPLICTSMNPGVTQPPVASITIGVGRRADQPGLPTATIRPLPSTTTCPASITPDGVTTAPPAIDQRPCASRHDPPSRAARTAPRLPRGTSMRCEADAAGEAGRGEHRRRRPRSSPAPRRGRTGTARRCSSSRRRRPRRRRRGSSHTVARPRRRRRRHPRDWRPPTTARPEPTASAHPTWPHGQGGPSGRIGMWPISPAPPEAPRTSRPPSTKPAAMPVPTFT